MSVNGERSSSHLMKCVYSEKKNNNKKRCHQRCWEYVCMYASVGTIAAPFLFYTDRHADKLMGIHTYICLCVHVCKEPKKTQAAVEFRNERGHLPRNPVDTNADMNWQEQQQQPQPQ
ncbi:unnamed protein product [Ceratitis capitata]|uniref:(Mediterranean fruit fly) hypothetical protein n=1 Tax=Ceratitis capitata TaxID=7213 RepID=A0A811TWG7_CERCA|nr:unnamed protein product [Ceratitis capitata]